MTIKSIRQTKDDAEFRRDVLKLWESAESSIIYIAGEFGALKYPDLAAGLDSAMGRGVQVEAYGNDYSEEVGVALRAKGARVFKGSLRSLYHFTVVDGKSAVLSLKIPNAGPTKSGDRHGVIFENEPETAKAIASYFRVLEASASGQSRERVMNKLWEVIEANPLLLQRIPLAQNLLDLMAPDSPHADLITKSALTFFSSERAGKSTNAAEFQKEVELQTVLSNHIALVGALIDRAVGQDRSEPRASAVPFTRASQKDVEFARSLASTRLRSFRVDHSSLATE